MASLVGSRVERKEDKKFLTGKGRYTADITLAGLVSDSLRQTVTELTFLEEAEVVDLDMIRGYKCLETKNPKL